MKRIVLITLILLVEQSLIAQQQLSFTYGGLTREYILYSPTGFSGLRPLVFNFHGYTNNMSFQMNYSEMNGVADQYGFYVIYPQGTPDNMGVNHWNAWQNPDDTDDIGFIDALLTEIIAQHPIDPQRVYSCGFSNGGIMSYGLALNLSNKFAAVASVAGTMTDEMIASGNPTRPVPIFHIHGNLDPVVPYDGSAGTLPTFGVLSSVNETLNFWNSIDGCTDYSTSNISNINVFDLCSASKRVYNGCAEHPNWYVEITGGGHTWPGTTPLTVTGNTCQDFNGSSLIWEFFSTCSLPTASSSEISSVKEMPVEYFNCLGKKISPNQITRGELIIVRWNSGRISKEMVY